MDRLVRFFVAAGLVLAAPSTSLEAQSCFGPDTLDGPCATATNANLPTFPALTMNGSGLSWIDCTPVPKAPVVITLTPPTMTFCGVLSATIHVFDATTGFVLGRGTLELVYSRTWEEIDPAGVTYQVWRFLVKGDLDTPPGTGIGVPVPNDSPSFYYGYVDYAEACAATPLWEHALVLFHNCDAFLHRPPIAAVPGTFDPNRTYAFVAPDTGAKPFDETAIPPPIAGPVARGALRDPGQTAAAGCCSRDHVVQGSITPLVVGCACPLTFNLPPRNAANRIAAFGGCGSGTISFDTNSIGFPWLHLISTAIGRWTTTAGYPGDEAALAYEGPVIWQESCSPQRFVELHYGAGTEGGWTHLVPAPLLPAMNLLDTCSNWSFPIPGPVGFPLVGMVLPSAFSRHVLYLDVF